MTPAARPARATRSHWRPRTSRTCTREERNVTCGRGRETGYLASTSTIPATNLTGSSPDADAEQPLAAPVVTGHQLDVAHTLRLAAVDEHLDRLLHVRLQQILQRLVVLVLRNESSSCVELLHTQLSHVCSHEGQNVLCHSGSACCRCPLSFLCSRTSINRNSRNIRLLCHLCTTLRGLGKLYASKISFCARDGCLQTAQSSITLWYFVVRRFYFRKRSAAGKLFSKATFKSYRLQSD